MHCLYECIQIKGFKVFTQSSDMHIDGALLHVNMRAPGLVQQLPACEYPVRVTHKVMQQTELGRRQVDALLIDLDSLTDRIEIQITNLDRLLIRHGASEHCLYTRFQFTYGKRLGDVVIRSYIEAEDTVLFLSTRGNHNDRKL